MSVQMANGTITWRQNCVIIIRHIQSTLRIFKMDS